MTQTHGRETAGIVLEVGSELRGSGSASGCGGGDGEVCLSPGSVSDCLYDEHGGPAYPLAVARVSVLPMVESDTARVSVLPFAGSERFLGKVALDVVGLGVGSRVSDWIRFC